MMGKIFRSRHVATAAMLAGALLAPLLVGFVFPGSASKSAWAEDAPHPNLQVRARELEERVRILELEQEALARRLHLQMDQNERTLGDIDKRLRGCEEKLVSAKPSVAVPAELASADARCLN